MMAQPKNMDEVRKWSDSQILQYLKEYWGKQNLTFEAYADQKPISTKDPQRYQGSISKLKFNGTNIKYPIIGSPIYFNIPITANINFEFGQCEIKCTLADRGFREKIGNMLFLKPLLSSFKVTGKIIPQKAEERDVVTLKRNLKLKDQKFIGLFTLNSKGSYIISDIRRFDFSSLILPNKKKQAAFLFSPEDNTAEVFVRYDKPHQCGNGSYHTGWSFAHLYDDFGSLRHLEIIDDNYKTIKVEFLRSIEEINKMFADRYKNWGVVNSFKSHPPKKWGSLKEFFSLPVHSFSKDNQKLIKD